MYTKHMRREGFTLIEVLMVVILISILAVASVTVLKDTTNEQKYEETMQEMREIRIALEGDATIVDQGRRTSFGFHGDMGGLPAAGSLIAQLSAIGTFPAWSRSATLRIAYGWNGPYLSATVPGKNYNKDAWQNNYVYTPATDPATIVSLGSDGAVGGTGFAADITMNFPTNQRFSEVYGQILLSAVPWATDAEVEVNYPNGMGAATTQLIAVPAADTGQFVIPDIPFGVRSFTVYEPDKVTSDAVYGPYIFTIDRAETHITIETP